MRGLWDDKESRKAIDRGATHFIDYRLIEIELGAGRSQRVVRTDRNDHLAAPFCKSTEVGIRRIEIAGEFNTPRIQGTALDVIERIGIQVTHQENSDSEYTQIRMHLRICSGAFLSFETGIDNETASGRIGIR